MSLLGLKCLRIVCIYDFASRLRCHPHTSTYYFCFSYNLFVEDPTFTSNVSDAFLVETLQKVFLLVHPFITYRLRNAKDFHRFSQFFPVK